MSRHKHQSVVCAPSILRAGVARGHPFRQGCASNPIDLHPRLRPCFARLCLELVLKQANPPSGRAAHLIVEMPRRKRRTGPSRSSLRDRLASPRALPPAIACLDDLASQGLLTLDQRAAAVQVFSIGVGSVRPAALRERTSSSFTLDHRLHPSFAERNAPDRPLGGPAPRRPGSSEARLLGGPNSFGCEVVRPCETVVIAEGVSSGLKSALR